MPAGRPPKWTNPEQVQTLADAYFESFNEGGKNYGKPITVTGLALALDTSRENLCNYQDRDEFFDTISKIKLRVEQFAEQRLYEGAATGPIFALKNFGWKDNQDLTHKGDKDNPIVTTLADTDKEILKRYFDNNKPE
jgi:hypothetical protein